MATPRIEELMDCLREARRLHNMTVRDADALAALHREMDRLLAFDPEQDDPKERFDAPSRVAHREFIDGLFRLI